MPKMPIFPRPCGDLLCRLLNPVLHPAAKPVASAAFTAAQTTFRHPLPAGSAAVRSRPCRKLRRRCLRRRSSSAASAPALLPGSVQALPGRPVTAESPLAPKAAAAMGMLFPWIGLPAGIIFLMLDDPRKTHLGWLLIGWSLAGTVISVVAASSPRPAVGAAARTAAPPRRSGAVRSRPADRRRRGRATVFACCWRPYAARF